MTFRLGYVAMTLNLKDCSPSGTVTLTHFNKITDEKARFYKLGQVARKNLENTLRILKYNKALCIKVYRLTSKLIPLATHPAVGQWDYLSAFKSNFQEIGQFIKENGFRVSAHPDHFTLINSDNPKVLEDSLRDLEYHAGLFEAMGLESGDYKLVLHIGGVYGSKQDSMERFKRNFALLPESIRKRIILENDDKSYTADDVLSICKALEVPMVLDIHHYKCANKGEPLEYVIGRAFDTWKNQNLPPKVHFSSPRDSKNFRSHADNIDPGEFLEFIKAAEKDGRDFDVMLEAKNKDSALLKLSEELALNPELERIDTGEFRKRTVCRQQ